MTDIEKQLKVVSEMETIYELLLKRRDALPQDETFVTYRNCFDTAITFLKLLVSDIKNKFNNSSCKRGIMVGVNNHLPLLFAFGECFRDQEVQKTEIKLRALWGSKSFPDVNSVDDLKTKGLLDDETIEMYKYKLKLFIQYLKDGSASSKKISNIIEDVNNTFNVLKFTVSRLSASGGHVGESINPNITLEEFLKAPDISSGKQILELLERAIDYNGIMTCFEHYMATLVSSDDFYTNSKKLSQFNLLFNNYIEYYMLLNANVFKFLVEDSSLLMGASEAYPGYNIFDPSIFSNVYFFCRTNTVIGDILKQYEEKAKITPSKDENPTVLIAGTDETQKIMKAAPTVVYFEEPVDEVEKLTKMFCLAIKKVSIPCRDSNKHGKVSKDNRLLLYKDEIFGRKKPSYKYRFIRFNINKVESSVKIILDAAKQKLRTSLPTDQLSIVYNDFCETLYEAIHADNADDAKTYSLLAIDYIRKLRKILCDINHLNVPEQQENKHTSEINSIFVKVKRRTITSRRKKTSA